MMEEKFNLFLETIEEKYTDFVLEINEYLIAKGCKCEIKSSKSGYTVSYIQRENKRTLATFVNRKTGVKIRIYPSHLSSYQEFLDTLPEKMKKEIRKSSVCKRLVNPDACNPKCIKGYDFILDKEHYQKCRYMAFLLTLNEESNPYVKQFLENELQVDFVS